MKTKGEAACANSNFMRKYRIPLFGLKIKNVASRISVGCVKQDWVLSNTLEGISSRMVFLNNFLQIAGI
jgi:hypothetical protein